MKKENMYERPLERLQTTDEKGNRVYIHPEDLKGKWKTKRAILYWFLISIYMILPWINIKGKQSVLLNIPGRKLTFFGNTFWGHDAPLLLFIILGFAFLIAFVTSIWGRVWCGWACPQTVFLDVIYRKIEAFIEGKSLARMKLEQAPWTASKIAKKSLKWFLFTLVSLHITHSFLGYFVGARKLFWITFQAPDAHWGLFLTMIFITAIILFNFGWFKEQFCIIMCPYGRFQSVLLDSDSLVVAYDTKRGEPRRGQHVENQGDCVNCYQCVKVCPTGIDIRRGLQLECIACTACIDACDNIMTKLKKPVGLISYTTENRLNNISANKNHIRTTIYIALLIFIIVVGFIKFKNSSKIQTFLVKGGRTPFKMRVENGKDIVLNHYKINFFYKGEKHQKIYFSLNKEAQEKGIRLTTPQTPLVLKKGRKTISHIFFRFPQNILDNGTYYLKLILSHDEKHREIIDTKDVTLVGPYSKH